MEEKLHEPAKISTTQGARPSGLRAGVQTEGLAEEARSSERPEAEGKASGAKGKAPARGALGRTEPDPEGTGALKRASRGEALGRTGADPAGLGKSFSGRSAGQHRGEPSRHRGLGILTR